MPQVTITVTGDRGVGKTTIIRAIQKMLEEKGFVFKGELEGRSYEKLILIVNPDKIEQLQKQQS